MPKQDISVFTATQQMVFQHKRRLIQYRYLLYLKMKTLTTHTAVRFFRNSYTIQHQATGWLSIP